jgi:hypothetical protein
MFAIAGSIGAMGDTSMSKPVAGTMSFPAVVLSDFGFNFNLSLLMSHVHKYELNICVDLSTLRT